MDMSTIFTMPMSTVFVSTMSMSGRGCVAFREGRKKWHCRRRRNGRGCVEGGKKKTEEEGYFVADRLIILT